MITCTKYMSDFSDITVLTMRFEIHILRCVVCHIIDFIVIYFEQDIMAL